MIGNYLKNIFREAHRGLSPVRETSALERLFLDSAPAVVAFRIGNGYVVRTHNPTKMVADDGFVYCADHQAIADYLVSSAMRDKLSVQGELFEKRPQSPTVSVRSI